MYGNLMSKFIVSQGINQVEAKETVKKRVLYIIFNIRLN